MEMLFEKNDDVWNYYFFTITAWLDENGIVSNLVRDFMQQNGDSCHDANVSASQKGSSDGQTVSEIVGKIGCKI